MVTDMEFMNRLFHAALRRDLERTIRALPADGYVARAGASDQRTALAEHVILLLDLLHHHHTGEDVGLWPLVRRRAPDLGAELDAMEAEHATVAAAIASARAAARGYSTTTDPSADGRLLREAIVGLRDALLPHLDHEETEVMPRVMRALTGRDWSALSRRELRNWGSLGLAGTGLVWMVDGLEPTQRAAFDRQVSSLFRWWVNNRYGPAYRLRTALAFGTPADRPAG